MSNVLITGSARGIGKAIAARLVRDGHRVAISDLPAMAETLAATRAELAALPNATVTSVDIDVTDLDSVKQGIATVVDVFGSLDVMVANAGVAQTKALLDVTPEDFDHVHRINSRGLFFCYTEAARQMIAQGNGGKIIGAGSGASHRSSSLFGVYSSSKFVVRALTHSAAAEWGRHGITVNAYAPGLVETDMWEQIDGDLAAINKVEKGVSKKAMGRHIPLGRLQTADDVASLVSYLAGPDSDYMTGQCVVIDGGIVMV